MNTFEKTALTAMAGMRAQSLRLQTIGENIANADTHGYRRKVVTFENIFDRGMDAHVVNVGSVTLDSKEPEEIFDPSHPLANEDGFFVGSNVNMMTEFADAREANRSYEAGLEVFRQAKDLYGSLLDILRR